MLIILCITAVQTFANSSVNSHLPFLITACITENWPALIREGPKSHIQSFLHNKMVCISQTQFLLLHLMYYNKKVCWTDKDHFIELCTQSGMVKTKFNISSQVTFATSTV